MTSVTVQYKDGSRYAQEIVSSKHITICDEPSSSGGGDLGPTTYELLLGALGSCTAITLLMYARRKNWDLASVSIDVNFRREETDEGETNVRREFIESEISLTGDLSTEQRERLLEIAGRCPVHRTLVSGPTLVDRLAPSAT
jgi:putative redox protein